MQALVLYIAARDGRVKCGPTTCICRATKGSSSPGGKSRCRPKGANLEESRSNSRRSNTAF